MTFGQGTRPRRGPSHAQPWADWVDVQSADGNATIEVLGRAPGRAHTDQGADAVVTGSPFPVPSGRGSQRPSR
jgi:hypothetical protein